MNETIKIKCKICLENYTKDICIKCKIPVCDICSQLTNEGITCRQCEPFPCEICLKPLIEELEICNDCGMEICEECVEYITQENYVICTECFNIQQALWSKDGD